MSEIRRKEAYNNIMTSVCVCDSVVIFISSLYKKIIGNGSLVFRKRERVNRHFIQMKRQMEKQRNDIPSFVVCAMVVDSFVVVVQKEEEFAFALC